MFVADAHCDFLYYMCHGEYDISLRGVNQAVSLPAMGEGGAAMQFFAAWIDPRDSVDPLQQCLTLIDGYKRMLASTDALVPLTRAFEPSYGKIACVLTVEGGEAVNGRTENLRLFYELGVRAMTLTWNERNELACPATARRDTGLTRLGKTVVREMERINMAIDVAHLGDRSMDDILDEVASPIFSSHTNARSVFDNRRSLSDRHIRAIAERGGVIGVNYYSPQLTKNRPASIEDVVRHIAHIAEVGGPKCVAFGSDFDGMGADAYPEGLSSWADVPSLTGALRRAGFSEGETEDIAYNNLAGYIKRFV